MKNNITHEAHALAHPRYRMLIIMVTSLLILLSYYNWSAITLAIPAIQSSLHSTINQASWIMNGYTLAYSVGVILVGRMGDLFGRRRIYFAGILLFTFASFITGLCHSIWPMVAIRVLCGFGAAIIWAMGTALSYTAFTHKRRSVAVGIALAMSGFGYAIGPFIAAGFLKNLGWQWIFYINLPLGLLFFIFALKTVKKHIGSAYKANNKSIDIIGVIWLVIMVVGFILAIDNATNWGWLSWKFIAAMIATAILLYGFVKFEKKQTQPLIRVEFFEYLNYRISCMGGFIINYIFGTIFFGLTIYLQTALKFTPLTTAGLFAVMIVTYGVCSFFTGRLYIKFGARKTLIGGILINVPALLIFAISAGTHSITELVIALFLLGLPYGINFACFTMCAVKSVSDDDVGLAASMYDTIALIGMSVGVAVTSTLMSHFKLVHGFADAIYVCLVLAVILVAILLNRRFGK